MSLGSLILIWAAQLFAYHSYLKTTMQWNTNQLQNIFQLPSMSNLKCISTFHYVLKSLNNNSFFYKLNCNIQRALQVDRGFWRGPRGPVREEEDTGYRGDRFHPTAVSSCWKQSVPSTDGQIRLNLHLWNEW